MEFLIISLYNSLSTTILPNSFFSFPTSFFTDISNNTFFFTLTKTINIFPVSKSDLWNPSYYYFNISFLFYQPPILYTDDYYGFHWHSFFLNHTNSSYGWEVSPEGETLMIYCKLIIWYPK